MRILSIPLDERPFNYDYAAETASNIGGIEFIQPPLSLLGSKKETADIERLWEFVLSESPRCDATIISAEMMLYGGLLPSRLHHTPVDDLTALAGRFRELRAASPKTRLLIFSLIMRIPSYDSDEEEPEYYRDFGRRLFQYSETLALMGRTPTDTDALTRRQLLEQEIPEDIRLEFLERRKTNHEVTKYLLGLYADGVFDDFIIPQDDNSPIGLQVLEREALLQKIGENDLKVELYAGADEVGCTLLSRVICDTMPRRPVLGPLWSTPAGRHIIPKYEGQTYAETVRRHVVSAGMELVDYSGDTDGIDMILAINTPALEMKESSDQEVFAPTQELETFVGTVERLVQKGIPVLVADVAYANGSDLTLVQLLNQRGLLGKISGYSAVNTNGNALGTVLAQGCAAFMEADTSLMVLSRLIDDCCYQAVVRKLVGAIYPYAWHTADKGTQKAIDTLMPLAIEYFIGNIPYTVHCSLPWNRLFECRIRMEPSEHAAAERQAMVERTHEIHAVHPAATHPHARQGLENDLAAFGIPQDSTILIHSSCKSIGPVEDGADTVLDVFQAYFKDGLLVFPTHTWDKVNPENPVFILAETPCCTGILPELFRKRPGVIRSGHPTHSVAAYGRKAGAFTADDIHCDTPCARGSSWGKLIDEDAVIMLLGVTFTRNTFMHGVEEWADIPGRLTDEHTLYYTALPDGRKVEVPSRRHVGHPSEMFDHILPTCIEKGIVRQGLFGDAPILWFKARELAVEVAWRVFLEPHLFDNPAIQD